MLWRKISPDPRLPHSVTLGKLVASQGLCFTFSKMVIIIIDLAHMVFGGFRAVVCKLERLVLDIYQVLP